LQNFVIYALCGIVIYVITLNMQTNTESVFKLYDTVITSRFLLGTAGYPSPHILQNAIKQSKTNIVTMSLRREKAAGGEGNAFWNLIKDCDVNILPNTAGCHSVKEAVTTAHMAREIFNTNWIKLEVIGNESTLQPNIYDLVEAARILCEDGFYVFPYTTEDITVGEKLLNVGCKVLMPWGSPIGTGLGLNNKYMLSLYRDHFKDIPLIIDAGLGLPSHAAEAMEMGFDAVLLNTAVAKAGNPVFMAEAFAKSIEAGYLAYLANPMQPQKIASPSTPVFGTAFSPWSI
jgi:thiazole synthase